MRHVQYTVVIIFTCTRTKKLSALEVCHSNKKKKKKMKSKYGTVVSGQSCRTEFFAPRPSGPEEDFHAVYFPSLLSDLPHPTPCRRRAVSLTLPTTVVGLNLYTFIIRVLYETSRPARRRRKRAFRSSGVLRPGIYLFLSSCGRVATRLGPPGFHPILSPSLSPFSRQSRVYIFRRTAARVRSMPANCYAR